MKLKQAFNLFLFGSLLLLAGCKKDEEVKSTTELIAGTSSKSWKIVSLLGKIGATEVDIFSVSGVVQDCEKDDLLVFFSNKDFERRAGVQKCKATDPDVALKSTWSLSADEKTLSVKDLGDFSILEISAQTMKYKAPYKLNNVTYEVTATLQAQ